MKKQLGLIHVFSIATGVMISSGIFILPGLAFSRSGPSVIVSYMAAGILALLGILSVIELVTAMPKSGGDYFIINRSLGNFVGTIAGMLTWFALSLKSAFAVFGLGELLHLLTGLNLQILVVAIALGFIALNLLGVDFASLAEVVLVVLLLSILGLYIAAGLFSLEPSRYTPFLSHGYAGLLSNIGFVFVSFGGLINVASIAEEVKKPGRNIPLGIILSVSVVTLLYGAILAVTIGILPGKQLSSSLSPIADGGAVLFGTAGRAVISVAAALAFITTANAGILSASRYPLALSRDKLLPRFVGFSKRNTPVAAVLLTGALVITALFLPLELLIKSASAVVLTTYILTNLSVIVLRHSKVFNYRPTFKAPLYPFLQIAAIIFYLVLIADLGWEAIEASIIFVIIGIVIFIFFGRKTEKRESALLHIVEGIVDRQLTSNKLESELRDIIKEREELTPDSTDGVFEQALVMDIQNQMDWEDCAGLVAETVARVEKMPAKAIASALKAREKESSTVLSPFLAVPHLILKGENRFKLIIVRAAKGICFPGEHKEVKALFFLLGTKDKRHLHLKVLSAIARITLEKGFNEAWLEAKSEDNLKDLLLLSGRIRFSDSTDET